MRGSAASGWHERCRVIFPCEAPDHSCDGRRRGRSRLDQIAKRRIEDALRETGDAEATDTGPAEDSGDDDAD
jgi:hypothetical protein